MLAGALAGGRNQPVHLHPVGHKAPQMITNWGPASFTEAELEVRKKWWQERKNQEAQGPAARQ